MIKLHPTVTEKNRIRGCFTYLKNDAPRVKREEDIHIYTRTYDSIQLESFYTARNKSLFPFNRERHRENERSGLREGRRRGERRSHRYNPARVCTCFTSTPRLFADSKLCRTIRVPLSRSRIIKRGKGKTCLARCSFFSPLSVSLCSTSASPPPFPSRRGVLDSSPNANVTLHLEISSFLFFFLRGGGEKHGVAIRRVNGARPGVVKVEMNVREGPSRLSLRSPLQAANIASQTAEFRPHDRDVSPFLFLGWKRREKRRRKKEETLYNGISTSIFHLARMLPMIIFSYSPIYLIFKGKLFLI